MCIFATDNLSAPLENIDMSIDTYKLTSMEEPTDEVLLALMEKVAQAARESNAKAEAEKRRRLQSVADEIKEWKRKAAI